MEPLPFNYNLLNTMRAAARLRRDLLEYEKHRASLPNVTAVALEENIHEWHVNLRAADSHDEHALA